jgi:VWFA-related protein
LGAAAQQESSVGEEVQVRMVLIEVRAEDAAGNTITDLTKDDLQVSVDGTVRDPDTFDSFCESGQPIGRVVYLFDYHNIGRDDQTAVLHEVEAMVQGHKQAGEEIMVAAIAGGLRIEQRFTTDTQQVVETLERMRHDSSLFGQDYATKTGKQWADAMATLMDVLAQYRDAKGVLMFSAITSRDDLEQAWMVDLAQRAAAAQVTIYPAKAHWMTSSTPRHGGYSGTGTAGARILPRLAFDTGGTVVPRTNDLANAYTALQDDFACHYTVGYEIEMPAALENHDIQMVTPRRATLKLRYPKRIKLWSEEDRHASALRAAFADPELLETPLVRSAVFPFRPTTRKKWDSAVMLSFMAPAVDAGANLKVEATLATAGGKIDSFERTFPLPAGEARFVTLLGDSTLKPGDYTLTIVLDSPDLIDLSTTQTHFVVPDVPRGDLFVNGPMLGSVIDEGGLLIRPDADEQQEPTELDRILESGQSFAPLVVHHVMAEEQLLLAWSACSESSKQAGREWVVERGFYDDEGRLTHKLESLSLKLAGDKVGCHAALDSVPGGTLPPGSYQVHVTVVDPSTGERAAIGSAPLNVN